MSKPAEFGDPDAFYSSIVEVHEGLSDEQCVQFNLALIFMLANHVGDARTLAKYVDDALASVLPGSGD